MGYNIIHWSCSSPHCYGTSLVQHEHMAIRISFVVKFGLKRLNSKWIVHSHKFCSPTMGTTCLIPQAYPCWIFCPFSDRFLLDHPKPVGLYVSLSLGCESCICSSLGSIIRWRWQYQDNGISDENYWSLVKCILKAFFMLCFYWGYSYLWMS